MRKLIISVAALILSSLFLYAQSPEDRKWNLLDDPVDLNLSSNLDGWLRYWDEGPITFKDIQILNGEWPKISEFECGIQWNAFEQIGRIGNTIVRGPSARTFMNPYASWAQQNYQTPDMLLYFQTGFDYMEICRRRAIKEFISTSNSGMEGIMNQYSYIANSFISQMKNGTNQGRDIEAVRYYSELVKSALSKTDDVLFDDLKTEPRGFGLGVNIGVGSEFFLGDFASYLTPIFGLDLSFDFVYRRFSLFLDGLLGWGGKYKKDIPLDGYQWEAGKNVTGGHIEASLGYTLFNSQTWRISPFVGVGVGFIDYPEYSGIPANPKKNSDEIAGFRFQAGISADYKYLRILEYLPFYYGVSDFAVRGRLFVARTNFPSPAPAWSINLGIGVNFLAVLQKK